MPNALVGRKNRNTGGPNLAISSKLCMYDETITGSLNVLPINHLLQKYYN